MSNKKREPPKAALPYLLIAAAVAVTDVTDIAVTVITAAEEDYYDNKNPNPVLATNTTAIVVTKQTHIFQLLSSDSTQYAKRSHLVQRYEKKDLQYANLFRF